MPMSVASWLARNKVRPGRAKLREDKFVGSFEKAVPVIFPPRYERRPLFPWLSTGLNPFRGTSERADGGS